MARSRKKSGSVKVNFKGVESRQTPAEGDYKFKVLEAVAGTSGNKNDQIEVTAEIVEGKNKGFKGYIYFPLQENSLWKLHAFLTALGQEIPDEEMDIDLSELVDEEFVGVLTHETYNGRKRAKLTDFDSIDNYSGTTEEDDDDDKPAKGKGKKGSKKADKGPKKYSRSDIEEMDEEELQEVLDANDDLDVDLDDFKKLPKKIEAVIEALEEEDLLEDDEPEEKPAKGKKGKKSKDDDEDEPEEKPAKGKKGAKGKKKSKKIDRSDVEDMDEDELETLLEEHDLDDEVDLDDYKSLKKKIAAVIEALDEADLLEDDD